MAVIGIGAKSGGLGVLSPHRISIATQKLIISLL